MVQYNFSTPQHSKGNYDYSSNTYITDFFGFYPNVFSKITFITY